MSSWCQLTVSNTEYIKAIKRLKNIESDPYFSNMRIYIKINIEAP